MAPARRAIEVSSDRLSEKDFFTSLRIPTARYRPFSTQAEMEQAAEELGYPCVAKTRRFGYDGKGQRVLENPEDAAGLADGTEMLLEAFEPFFHVAFRLCHESERRSAVRRVSRRLRVFVVSGWSRTGRW